MKQGRAGRIVCLAPKRFQALLGETFDRAGFELQFRVWPTGRSTKSDPYRIQKFASRFHADALLIIAPRSRSPYNVTSSPLVRGIPVGVLSANEPHDLLDWTTSLQRGPSSAKECAVLCMWHPRYIPSARKFAKELNRQYPRRIRRWFADRTSRESLCQRLANGPRVVVYIGHGDRHGWAGYRGIHWEHLDEPSLNLPSQVVIAFACDTVKGRSRNGPFGLQYVLGGRALSYLGSGRSVYSDVNAVLVHEAAKVLTSGRVPHVGAFLSSLERQLQTLPPSQSVLEVFRTYRLIGHPLAPML